MENISITKKLQYYNSRLSNPSTSIVSWMVSRLSKYLDEVDLDSFFHTISLMEVEKKEVEPTLTIYSPLSKKLDLARKFDLHQKYGIIDQEGKELAGFYQDIGG